jgi:hypothetical protein
MRRILLYFFKKFRSVESGVCTFLFKRMISSYGCKLGVNSLSISSSHAKVEVGNNDIGFVFERSENMKQSVVLPPHE